MFNFILRISHSPHFFLFDIENGRKTFSIAYKHEFFMRRRNYHVKNLNINQMLRSCRNRTDSKFSHSVNDNVKNVFFYFLYFWSVFYGDWQCFGDSRKWHRNILFLAKINWANTNETNSEVFLVNCIKDLEKRIRRKTAAVKQEQDEKSNRFRLNKNRKNPTIYQIRSNDFLLFEPTAITVRPFI